MTAGISNLSSFVSPFNTGTMFNQQVNANTGVNESAATGVNSGLTINPDGNVQQTLSPSASLSAGENASGQSLEEMIQSILDTFMMLIQQFAQGLGLSGDTGALTQSAQGQDIQNQAIQTQNQEALSQAGMCQDNQQPDNNQQSNDQASSGNAGGAYGGESEEPAEDRMPSYGAEPQPEPEPETDYSRPVSYEPPQTEEPAYGNSVSVYGSSNPFGSASRGTRQAIAA